MIISLINADLKNNFSSLAEPSRVYEKLNNYHIRRYMNAQEMFDIKYNRIKIDSSLYNDKQRFIDHLFIEDSIYHYRGIKRLMMDKIYFDIQDDDTIYINSPFVEIDTIINYSMESYFHYRNDSLIFENKCPVIKYSNTHKDIISNYPTFGYYATNYIIKIYTDSLEHRELINKHGNIDEKHFKQYYYIIPFYWQNYDRELGILFRAYRCYGDYSDYYINY